METTKEKTTQGDPTCCPHCKGDNIVFENGHVFWEQGEDWDLDQYVCKDCDRDFFV